MKRLLARLFGGGNRAAVSTAGAPASAPLAPALDLAMLDLDLAFFHWLTGPHLAADTILDAPILDELARLARDPAAAASLVPRVPAVVPQLLRSLRSESGSSGDLARKVAQDAVLVAEVIREVNSPYYRPATPVRNLEGALLLLGQNGLRMLLARVAFRPIINQQAGTLARETAPILWRQAEKCALAAALLAPRHGADPFEAYLAGLMHNVGLVVALRVIDQLAPGGALPDLDDFALRVVAAARLLSRRIADGWELPAAIGHAIVHLGDPEPLPAALGQADRLAKLRMLAAGGQPAFVRAATAIHPELRRAYDQLDDPED